LPSNSVSSVAAGPDGTIWCGTDAGAACFDGVYWKTWSTAEGLAGPEVRAIAAGPSGEVWAGTRGNGVSRFDESRWVSFTPSDGLADSTVGSLAVSPDGTAWFATANGLSRYRNGTWTTFTAADGLPETSVRCVAVAPDGTVWAGTDSGAARFDGKTWKGYSVSDGLADNQVLSIAVASGGAVWFGTAYGLSRLLPDPAVPVMGTAARPARITLDGNYPNPFNPSTTLSFTLSEPGNVELAVYSITGRKVRTLVSGVLPAGERVAVWDGTDETGTPVSSGVYVARLRAGGMVSSRRMLLLK
jgi:ligand-binding sensor domain-containing protein